MSENLELANLQEDSLIEVFKYLDRNSLLNTIATCKRFEGIITKNIQFYGKFQLYVDRWLLKNRAEYLKDIRRNFGRICISNLYLSEYSKFAQFLLRILKKIGGNVVELEIQDSKTYIHSLMRVLNQVRNIKKLRMLNLEFLTERGLEEFRLFVSLEKLKYLELNNVDFSSMLENDKILQFNNLHHLEINASMENWEIYETILVRQKNLRSLELNDVLINDFEPLPANSLQIEKLTMSGVRFQVEQSFKNFSNFLMTQTKISELKLDISQDEFEHENNYNEILIHLLNQEALTRLEFEYIDVAEKFSTLPISNPNLKSLQIGNLSPSTKFGFLFRYFPNIQKLILFNGNKSVEDLVAINSLGHLTEIYFHYLNEEDLQHICLSQLKKFSAVFLEDSFHNYLIWLKFAENNPGIDHLVLPFLQKRGEVADLGHLSVILGSFVRNGIKTLKCRDTYADDAVFEEVLIEQIGINCSHLEHLEFKFHVLNDSQLADVCARTFPLLKLQTTRTTGEASLATLKKQN